MTRTRTQITIQTRQRITVRPLHDSFVLHCEHCAEEALMLTPQKAADVMQTTLFATLGLLTAGKLHAVETTNGSLICCNSITTASLVEKIEFEGERQ